MWYHQGQIFNRMKKNPNLYLLICKDTSQWHWVGLRKGRRHKGLGACSVSTAVVLGLMSLNCGWKPLYKRTYVNLERDNSSDMERQDDERYITHWDWLTPAGGCQQGPSRSKQCLGRASGGKEDLSGKSMSGSRQVRRMAVVEVSMVGHWRSQGLRSATENSIKRRVWGSWAVKSPVFEDKKPEGEIRYFRAPLGLESTRPYWVIELGTAGYHRNEPPVSDSFAWFFIFHLLHLHVPLSFDCCQFVGFVFLYFIPPFLFPFMS